MATSFYIRYPSASGSSSNAANGTTGATAPTTATEVGFVDGSGNLQPFSGTSAATGPNVNVTGFPLDKANAGGSITVVDSGTTSNAYANGQVWVTGTPTPGSFVVFPNVNSATTQLEIGGTWTGTLQVEVSVDGGTVYTSHSIHPIGAPFFTSSFTNNVIGSISTGGKTQVRVRATAAMTGTATVRSNMTTNVVDTYIANPVKLLDASVTGSTTQAYIKAASTAAVATDNAIVVAVSPNNTPVLPSGAASAANQATLITQTNVATNGAATSALQTTGNSSLATIATQTNVGTNGAATSANQTTANGSLATIATNSGTQATAANQTSGNTSLSTIATQTNVGTNGASTSALQTAGNTSLSSILANQTNGTQTNKAAGKAQANAPVYNVYSTTNITTTAFVQLIASTTAATTEVHIFDSSGQAMQIATGASGSEVVQYDVAPGGETFPLSIAAGTRVSYRALTANATGGYLLVNLLG